MNLTNKGFLVAMFAAVFWLSLGCSSTVTPSTEAPSNLELNSVYISPDDQVSSEFGTWKLKGLTVADLWEPLREYNNRNLGYQEDASMWVYSNTPYIVNAKGLAVHKVLWQRDSANLEWLYPSNQNAESPWRASQIPESIKTKMLRDPKISKFAEFDDTTPDYLWHSAAISYISGLIEPPKLNMLFKNQGQDLVTVYGIRAKNLYSTGGEASDGGSQLNAANNQQTINLNHLNPVSELVFDSPVLIESSSTATLQVQPIVSDATQGDGEGELTYNLYVLYANGEETVEQFVGTFVQSDAISQMPLW